MHCLTWHSNCDFSWGGGGQTYYYIFIFFSGSISPSSRWLLIFKIFILYIYFFFQQQRLILSNWFWCFRKWITPCRISKLLSSEGSSTLGKQSTESSPRTFSFCPAQWPVTSVWSYTDNSSTHIYYLPMVWKMTREYYFSPVANFSENAA